MRVLITGMGGEIGTRVAQLLEERREVTEIVGVDFVPPRRRLRRSEFRRIDPRDRDKLAAFAAEVAPGRGRALRDLRARFPAAAEDGGALHRGRGGRRARWRRARREAHPRRAAVAASRSTGVAGVVPACPTRTRRSRPPRRSAGASSRSRRSRSTSAGATTCRSTALRMATIAGSHVPSPLGRVLRLPAVPVPGARRSGLPAPARRRRGAVDGAGAVRRRSTVRSTSSASVPRACGRRCASAAGCRCRSPVRCGRSRPRPWSSRARPAPPHVHRAPDAGQRGRRLARRDRARARRAAHHARRVHRAVRVGHRHAAAAGHPVGGGVRWLRSRRSPVSAATPTGRSRSTSPTSCADGSTVGTSSTRSAPTRSSRISWPRSSRAPSRCA